MDDKTTQRFKILGLTGGIGSGKSTVARLFSALSVTVINSDQITRDLVAPDQSALEAIVNHFDANLLNADGSLNREKLRARIFHSPSDRIWLENLLHPLVRAEILTLKSQIPAKQYAVVEIPLLIETQFESEVDRVLVVDCPEAIQITRATRRDGASAASIVAIMQSQVTRSARLAKADDIIVNTGSLDELEAQVSILHQKYALLAKS